MRIKNRDYEYIPKKKRGFSPLVWIVLSASVLVFLAFYRFTIPRLTPLKEKITDINKRLTYMQITPAYSLSIPDQPAGELYEISLQKEFLKETYLFNKYQYVIEGVDRNNLCAIVDSMQNSDHKKIRDIIEKTKVSAELTGESIFSIKVELQTILAELYYLLSSIGKDYPVDIYIKGFADGYKVDWSRPLDKRKNSGIPTSNTYLPSIQIRIIPFITLPGRKITGCRPIALETRICPIFGLSS